MIREHSKREEAGPIRLLLVERYRLMRQSLRALLERERDIMVVGEAADGREAVNLALAHKPDLALIDLDTPSRDGVTATKLIHGCVPDARILVVSAEDDDARIVEAVQAGAFGYLLKDADSNDLVRCLRAAFRGQHLLSPFMPDHFARRAIEAVGQTVAAEESPLSKLTEREREILACAAMGRTNKEIADQLCVSLDTVKTHLHHIYRKLSVNGRVEAVLAFLQTK
ncbi:MAG: response regulator transcription factor [Nitrospira sp.]|nr:response regulator transcription factor [Nitrospira sp.]MCP9441819.1 response regulator transcription factor [Nitrospira sp.]